MTRLDAVSARAGAAAATMRGLGAAGGVIARIDRATGGLRRDAADINAYGRALDDTRAKYNPTFAVVRDYRAELAAISRDNQGRPAYGGTPSDSAVVQAIQELKARGYRVMFHPFILMDVAPDNELPDPYSDGAAAIGQPTYPRRGRITCSPAACYAGSPDKTAAAGTQVAAFFGDAQPSDFDVDDERVSWDGTMRTSAPRPAGSTPS